MRALHLLRLQHFLQPGQIVVVTEARGRTLLQAIADEPIGTDEHVIVDSVVGNSVKVHKV